MIWRHGVAYPRVAVPEGLVVVSDTTSVPHHYRGVTVGVDRADTDQRRLVSRADGCGSLSPGDRVTSQVLEASKGERFYLGVRVGSPPSDIAGWVSATGPTVVRQRVAFSG